MKKALTIGLGVISTISFAMAQATLGTGQVGAPGASNAGGILGLVATLQTLLDRAVPLLIAFAVLGLFFFGIRFAWKGSSDPKAREDSIKGMGYSVLAIFMMVAIWGIIAFVANLTGIGVGGTGSPIIPVLPGSR